MTNPGVIRYGRQSISKADLEAVARQLSSDWLTTGPVVTEFEQAISKLSGGHDVIAVSSGTSALHCIYATLDLKSGDEVITSPITFISTAATAIKEGAVVKFADISPGTANINPEAVEALISSRTKAIVAVDFAGNPADYRELGEIATRHNLTLVADASHSLGAKLDGRPVGDWADFTTFSFFPTKNIATGEGGAVVSKDLAKAKLIRRYRTHGLIRDPGEQKIQDEGPWHQEVHTFGLNYRLTDFQAALGLSQIARLEGFIQRRQEIFDRYSEAFSDKDGLATPSITPGASPAWHLYPLQVPASRRLAIYETLRSAGVLAQVNYLPVYWHPVFQDLGYARGLCPNAENFYRRELSLPMYVDLQPSEQDRVIKGVIAAL